MESLTKDELKETRSKTDFLDSLDEKREKIINKIYLILAFWVVLAPMITTLFFAVGIELELTMHWGLIALMFGLVWVAQFSFNITKIKLRKPSLFQILGCCLGLVFVVVMMVSGVKNFVTILEYLTYILVFCLFVKIDKKYYKALAYTFIIEMTVDSILAVIDLENKFIPGFYEDSYAFSMQFFNPNYSAYVVVFAIMLCIYYFLNSEAKKDKIINSVCFVLLNVFLFFNGTFAAETTLFLAEVTLIIYYWIKNKKFPLWLGLAFLITFICSFFRIDKYSASGSVYIVEVIALVDSFLGTNMLGFVADLFGGYENIIRGITPEITTQKEFIDMASNIDITKPELSRGALISRAIGFCTSGVVPFLFGNGIGFTNDVVRPHNMFVWWWLDLGIIFTLLFYAMCVVIIVMFAKCKSREKFLFPFIVFCMYLFMYNFGVMDYSFVIFIVDYAILYKGLKEENKKTTEN